MTSATANAFAVVGLADVARNVPLAVAGLTKSIEILNLTICDVRQFADSFNQSAFVSEDGRTLPEGLEAVLESCDDEIKGLKTYLEDNAPCPSDTWYEMSFKSVRVALDDQRTRESCSRLQGYNFNLITLLQSNASQGNVVLRNKLQSINDNVTASRSTTIQAIQGIHQSITSGQSSAAQELRDISSSASTTHQSVKSAEDLGKQNLKVSKDILVAVSAQEQASLGIAEAVEKHGDVIRSEIAGVTNQLTDQGRNEPTIFKSKARA
ncbi:hypothetical protein BDY21DRAFT_360220 [Lineolata rhizophorae]|uniref:Fungal N-terminal domain-containing protein n=1 Tax=Lineolata rhizophorae TaxID=578093 RepID=A0A6A6PEW9_9PEZI|nr:hypothetical protein BDY21DRAFT_360220 [Lineolata rhizophorae]